MLAIPVVALATRSPSASGLVFLLGLVSIGTGVLVHLVTLPTEWDASFTRALPLLKGGHYINTDEERQVRRILRACALTYVAGSLASLLNMARWIAVLRR
jgi:Zn-dependent membrane protease YugP